MIRKLFRNARITTPIDRGIPLSGSKQGDVQVFERGALYCLNGTIKNVGTEEEVFASLSPGEVNQEIDCRGLCLIPGFVDPHTHMCFTVPREEEFLMRLQGADYLEILQQGGGILSSVRAVRAASDEELFSATLKHALSALRLGTTTLEIKSGYGLNTTTELRMLQTIDRVGRETPLDVVATFLGAHAIAEEYAHDPGGYAELVIEEMIPAVAKQGIARFCDVFCEEGIFPLAESRRILEAAKGAGLEIKMHTDEIHDPGASALAAELQATSADHLLAAGEENLQAMAARGVIGVLLPATAYSMRKGYAPARKMVEMGLPLALATDCNPGSSYTESMPFVIGLAVYNMHMTVNEALVAATLNAAYALNMAETVGSLDVGKSADFLLLDGKTPAILPYRAGVSPIVKVFKRGEEVS
ncbi:imidazolonepropionase [Desulforhabdus amnigena]|jgi:imidazolonepropionase|uniref:Imidazolonepropionase n=1 Tax=Desulforhabdus amnigena TaxID=40218 RepID=A0A9W6FRE2_9BACT|nr:imidazolonepropionase [Desulforhabdus amnigena]NLJ27266.1 imidazolonepropionase [Deltaproteobacteria bacterium]GLI32914.1 imidazolonepropionase [Desulforhabdus amnigena]